MSSSSEMEKSATGPSHAQTETQGFPYAESPTTPLPKAVERRILRKLDLTLIPLLWFLFLVTFIDRGNIANAKISGMVPALHLTGDRYNVAFQVFVVAYVAFGVPSTILFKALGPRTLAVMMFFWGICVVGQGVTKSYAGLVVCRFLEGIMEAGFVPGAAYLIGSYYRGDEFLKRYAFFFGASVVAGAFNGLLAYALVKMNGVGHYEGWRWIFIIEGCATILVSIICFPLMVQFPEKTKMFTAEEKTVLLARLDVDGAKVAHDKLHFFRALKDWKIWAAVLIYIGAEENSSSVVAFQPTVLAGLGYTASEAQIHTIPVYAVAWAVSMTCAVFADRLRQRYVFGMFGFFLTTIGLAIEIAQPKHDGVKYTGMFFLAAGVYVIMPVTVVWLAINLEKGYKRTIGLGVLIAIGNCGAFISSNVFLPKQAPKFHTGFSVGMGMNILSGIGLTWMYVGLRFANHSKGRNQAMYGDRTDDASIEDLGEKHPDFRYSL